MYENYHRAVTKHQWRESFKEGQSPWAWSPGVFQLYDTNLTIRSYFHILLLYGDIWQEFWWFCLQGVWEGAGGQLGERDGRLEPSNFATGFTLIFHFRLLQQLHLNVPILFFSWHRTLKKVILLYVSLIFSTFTFSFFIFLLFSLSS